MQIFQVCPTYKKGSYGCIFWRLKLGKVIHSAHHFLGYRVVDSKVAILDILVRQVPSGGHLMPVRALSPPLAFALDEEATYWCPIPLHRPSETVKLLYDARCHREPT